MTTYRDSTSRRAALGWVISGACTILLLCLAVTAPVLADGPEDCVLCHQAETQEWQRSPHAMAASTAHLGSMPECQDAGSESCTCLACHTTNFSAVGTSVGESGVTCQACHGPYVEGHPGEGIMLVDVNSSTCRGCHVQTYEDWQHTTHGEAGVQCIGCHRSHSQDLRLADQRLCESCHEQGIQDAGHLAHQRANIACIDCHVSPAETILVSTQEGSSGHMARSHRFVVTTDVCAECHGADFHKSEEMAADLGNDPGQPGGGSAANSWLQAATASSLGLGIGIGGMMGIAFVLVTGHLQQRQRRSVQ